MLFFDITKRTVSRLRTCSRTVLLAGLDAAELPGSDETGCSLRDMTVPYSVPKRVTFRGNPFGYRRRHYYLRTTRSLATQHLFGNKLDPDIDQALDFTYKLDRKIFQTMITKNKEYGLAGRIRDKKRPNRSQNRQFPPDKSANIEIQDDLSRVENLSSNFLQSWLFKFWKNK